MHKRIITAVLALSLLTGCAGALPDELPQIEKNEDSAEFSIDALTPGDDFYGYINAKTLMETKLPADRESTGTLDEIMELTEDRVSDIITEIAAGSGYAKGSNEQLIHDLYHLALDAKTGALDTSDADTAFLDALFEEVVQAETIEDLFALWGRMCSDFGFSGVPVPVSPQTDLYHADQTILSVDLYPRSLGLEDIAADDYEATRERNEYQSQLSQLGISREEARARATDIVLAEIELSSVLDYTLLDDLRPDLLFHPYKTSDLRKELKNITAEQIMQMNGISFEMPDEISLSQPDQLRIADSLLDSEHLSVWKDYTLIMLLNEFQYVLPPKYQPQNNAGHMKDDEYAEIVVNQFLSKEIGEEYAERYCTDKTVKDVTEISSTIIAEYEALIRQSDRISEKGKTALCKKLGSMTLFVGADQPHKTDAKDAEQIGDSLLTTLCAQGRLEREEKLAAFGKPSDRNGFHAMPPQTVNACYIPEMNAFNITAAIMSEPLYDPNGDYYSNLGGIGAIIGHEISHGFDADGMNYDDKGNYNPEWIPQEDHDAFAELTESVIAYYNNFKVLDTHHVNGRKTLSENLADISGVQCVLAIAEKPENQKKVYESYAKVWKQLITDSSAKNQLQTDVHAPSAVRINAVVACFDSFYEIYGVTESDALYVAPDDRVRRW